MILLGYSVLLLFWSCCSAQNECTTPPPRRRKEVLTEAWNKASYPHGTRATYACRPGYIKLGRVIFQCNNGIWEHAPPYTECRNKPCGHPGDIPFGSFDLTEGTEFVFGARVEYKCNDGYQMLSQRHVRECLADGWSNDLPHCEVAKCLPITAPENGRIVMSGSYEMDQEFSFGQAIRFECNEDYKLKGDREIYCSATGDWSQEVPQCIEITCTPPTILNGGVMVPKRLYKENERIQFNCDTGFKFNERSDAVCTEDGWRPAPLCIEVTCDPPKVADGSFFPSKTIYREEDVITVDCKRGFHFDSFSGNTAQCTKNGWIPVPKCVLRPCDYPQVENIELSGYYQSNRERAFPAKIGSSTYYRCAHGYITATEEDWVYIRCTTDGWDPAPKCIKTCSVPRLENGRINYSYRRKFREGETTSYSCYQGYSPENEQDRITCTRNGWSPTPRCIPEATCRAGRLENGRFHTSYWRTSYKINARITYSCNSENNRENQQRTVICTKNGWQPTPRCIPDNICKKVEITDGYFTEKKDIFNLNEETTYRCVIGYTTPDGNVTGKIRCIRTGWSPSPGCSKTCTRPNLENILLKTSKIVFSPGDGLTYECADGYQTIHKSASGYTKCSKNGWTPEPQCVAIECGMLTLAKGTISPQEGKYRNGDVITFSCAKSHTRVGPDSAQCYYFGWSPAPPLCKEEVRFCEQPQAILNGSIISEIQELYEHGTIMEYQCNFRFKMIGSSKIECIDGKWSPSPSCTEEVKICGSPLAIPNGSSLQINQTEYFHGDSVAYGCEMNFEIWGTGEAQCLSGEWTHLPICADKAAQCAVPRSSEDIYIMPHKFSSEKKVNFGTVLKYKCKTDNKNTKEITCVSGKWLPEIECKPKELKKQCPPPPQVPGALKVTETRNYESGEEIAFQCLENFEASPSMDKIVCEDGKWQSPPRCVEINACGLPPPLENGKLRQEHQHLEVEQSGAVTYPNGFVLEYTCHTGFMLKGRSKITCSMGTWTEGPTCDEMPCGKVPTVLNGVSKRGTKNRYKAGETVHYECNQGFIIRGEENIICQAGNWTKPPVCEDVTCGPPPQVANADFVNRPQMSVPGTKVKYRCRSNFQLVGSNEVTCENSQWSQAPTCQDVRCGPPPNVANADIIPTDNEMYPPGTRVQYKCHRGFWSVGLSQVICENREWSQPPTCQDATCGSPPAIVDGWTADTKRERYFPGEIIRYRCRHGQTLTGPARVVCKEGNWSPPGTPACNEAAGRCGPPPTIENGDTTTFPSLYYERDAVVTYKCKNLYIIKGSEYVTCNSGQWTEPPICIEPCTASEQDMAENNIRLRWAPGEKLYSPSGDVIEFECIPGYERDPAFPTFRVHCQEGNLPFPRCKLRGTSG